MRSRNRSGPAGVAEARPTRLACPWSSGTQPRTSASAEFSCDEELSPKSARPGSDTCRIAGAAGSPTHRLLPVRSADKRSPPANDRRPNTVGRLPLWQSRPETGAAFLGTRGATSLYTIYWGLLKQPDNQKLARVRLSPKTGRCLSRENRHDQKRRIQTR